jgi:uroporphyrin-III C-methyltransferase/precorrin-2 dehydrogenase/sirohydrochlorin ferrochelatase
MPAERTVFATLGSLADAIRSHGVRAPAIIVVGEVVRVAHPDAYPWSRAWSR